ncbi:MAG: 50S ribosomal protein L18 [SAR202 cluster bacterium]|nr:50S ribosomal protein L18 [SAR202 cluster bacterium]
MSREGSSTARRVARHQRVRRKVKGTADRPRLAVFRSLNHIYAQVIDDTKGVTLAAASSMEGDVKSKADGQKKVKVSEMVGKLVAVRAKAQGVSAVVFDRGGYLYHGRIKAVADAARKGGLSF